MDKGPDHRSAHGEVLIVSGMAVVVGAGLFEWLVISPDHPGHALLRVIGAGLAASLGLALTRRR